MKITKTIHSGNEGWNSYIPTPRASYCFSFALRGNQPEDNKIEAKPVSIDTQSP